MVWHSAAGQLPSAGLLLFRRGDCIARDHLDELGCPAAARLDELDLVHVLDKGVVRCPGRKSAPITPNKQVFFREEDCGRCKKKPNCTRSSRRSLTLHSSEDLLIKLRQNKTTPEGRCELRKRVVVEHRLARVGAIQETRARYRGVRKNELDLNRTAAIANLLEVARRRCA